MIYENYFSNNIQNHGACSPPPAHQENVPITPSSSNSPISYSSSFESSNESLNSLKKLKNQRQRNVKKIAGQMYKTELNDDTPNSLSESQSFVNFMANNNSVSSPLSESQIYLSEIPRDDMILAKSRLEGPASPSSLYHHQTENYNNLSFNGELSSINTIFNTNQIAEPKLSQELVNSNQQEYHNYHHQPFHQSLSCEAYNANVANENISYAPMMNSNLHAYQNQCQSQYQNSFQYHDNQYHEYFHSHDQNMHEINYMINQPVPDETINYSAYRENEQRNYNSEYYHDTEYFYKKNQAYHLTPDLGSDDGDSDDDESLFNHSDQEMNLDMGNPKGKRKYKKKTVGKNQRQIKELEEENTDGMSISAKRKRKRILNRLQRAEATMREKRRMLKLNKAFEDLRKVLPIAEFAKNKLSRAETLKSAIEYIERMSEMLTIY